MEVKELAILIGSISEFSGILPLGIFLWKREARTKYLGLFLAIVSATTLDIFSFVTFNFNIHNHYLYHLMGLTELIFLSLFFHRQNPFGKFLRYLIAFIIAFYVLNSLWLEPIWDYNSMNAYGRSMSTLFLLFLSLRLYYYIYTKELIADISTYSPFIMNAGLLTYFSLSFFAFLLSNHILTLPLKDIFSAGWVLVLIANIQKNILIAISLLLPPSE